MTMLDYLPGYRIDKNTVVNCAMPNFPSNGGGGGGGGTTPNPPGTYNPCDGDPMPVGPGGVSFEKGTRLMVGAPTNCDEISGPPVITSTQTPQQYLMDHIDLNVAEYNFVNNPSKSLFVAELVKFLINKGMSIDNADFVHWAIGYLDNNPFKSLEDFKNQYLPVIEMVADPSAYNWTENDNEVLFDSDQSVYQQYQDSQPWPTIKREDVLPFEKFIPIRKKKDDPTKYENCLVLSKEQLATVGYTCSGYLPGGQTFLIYTTQDGVNLAETKKAISYMISSLTQKIPVLIGIDNRDGAPSVNRDGSTDHYVVVVGMGTDEKGKYFQFTDNATNNPATGASYSNRLYYNSSTGKITGKTAIADYRNLPGMHDYIVTQIRKSIKK